MGRTERLAANAEAASSSGTKLSSRSMDRKGVSLHDVVGKRVTVLYEEGAGQVVPYAGVVTFSAPARCSAALPIPVLAAAPTIHRSPLLHNQDVCCL